MKRNGSLAIIPFVLSIFFICAIMQFRYAIIALKENVAESQEEIKAHHSVVTGYRTLLNGITSQHINPIK
jgi:hypothetical protein